MKTKQKMPPPPVPKSVAYKCKPGDWVSPFRDELPAAMKRPSMRKMKPGCDRVVGDLPYFLNVPKGEYEFDRKKITSALCRFLPNGRGNEIGVSVNIRALRYAIMLRTAAASKWEVRSVYNQIYDLVKDRFPLIFYRAKTRVRDGLREIYGMRMRPYEIEAGDPNAPTYWEVGVSQAEPACRRTAG